MTEVTDPLDRGGKGKRLPDFGEEGREEAPRSVFDNFRIALGRLRGGVAAAGKIMGDGGAKAWVVGPDDMVDARGRARLMKDPSLRISWDGTARAEAEVACDAIDAAMEERFEPAS